MKTQISRNSRVPSNRYSGVYQQQGRMLTDADWNELSDLVKERLHQALTDVLGSGVPKDRGMIELKDKDREVDSMRWGRVFVNGIPAEVRPRVEEGEAPPESFEFDKQADLPPGNNDALITPPATGEYWLYVDVWDRTVTSLEDGQLRDPALQGADTCTRTQTMAQIKWAESAADIEALPQKGNAPLSLILRQGRTEPDPCDPCAEEVNLDMEIGNYLFRVEVHDAEYNNAGRLLNLTLKWSSENGAEQYEVQEADTDYPPGFLDYGKWTYEFFSGADALFASEKHLGVFLQRNNDYPLRGPLVQGNAPEGEEEPFSLIRRWDGYCTLSRSNPSQNWTVEGADRISPLSTASGEDAPGHVDVDDTLMIGLSALDLEVALRVKDESGTERDAVFVPGDFWYAPVRERVHMAGDVILPAQEPEGIRHHYLKLAKIVDGNVVTEDTVWNGPGADGEHPRKFPFPRLSELDAQDVGYTPACDDPEGTPDLKSFLQNKLGADWPGLNGREASVRDVLDALLCDMNAAHLPLDVDDTENCLLTRDENLETVQQALNRLCERIRDLTAEDIAFTLPECAEPSLKTCLEDLVEPKWKPENPGEPTDVAKVLETLLCQLNARHLPMDPTDSQLCHELKEDKTVQDALNTLCLMRRQGCVTLSLDPADGDIAQVIETQVQNDPAITDVHVCLRTGEFRINKPVLLKDKGHIKISGAGKGTRIVLGQGEKVLEFEGCKSVIVEDVHLESETLSTGLHGRNGLLHALNCGPVQAERVSFKTAAGVRTKATGVTVRMDDSATAAQMKNARARIRECEFNVGHLQQGILLINMKRSMVEDNVLRVVPKPKNLTFDTLVNNKARRNKLVNRLISNFKIDKTGVTGASKGDEKTFHIAQGGKTYKVTMKSSVPENQWTAYFKNNPPKDADMKDEVSFEAYLEEQINNVVDNPDKLPSYKSQSNRMRSIFEAQGTMDVYNGPGMKAARRNMLAGETKVEAAESKETTSYQVALKVGSLEARFDSELPTDVWKRVLQDVPSAKRTESKLEGALRAQAEKLIVDAAYRDKFAEAKAWWEKLRTESNPAVAVQGIVCAGHQAEEVRIHNNSLEGVNEGIHVGTSANQKNPNRVYHSGTVFISGNVMSLRRPVEQAVGVSGIFVGNCRHLTIENNRIKVPTFKKTKSQPFHHNWGVLIFGYLGRMVVVRQNRTQHCRTGVGVFARPQSESGNMWVAEYNLAEGANIVVNAPDFIKSNNIS
ncbi:DUF6519 domain-containing protein [Nitrospina sp. 32_T5]|uniref:DUF6519 domain-containing protein n=1 Tax=unclassified Nitrospina TaxID=2638683 RepID=UPI003F98A433